MMPIAKFPVPTLWLRYSDRYNGKDSADKLATPIPRDVVCMLCGIHGFLTVAIREPDTLSMGVTNLSTAMLNSYLQ